VASLSFVTPQIDVKAVPRVVLRKRAGSVSSAKRFIAEFPQKSPQSH